MMATAKVLPQIEAQILAADAEQACDELEKEKELHLSINYVSYSSDELHNPHTSLQTKLGKVTSRVYTKVRSKFKSHHYCVWSSKAVVLILLWNLMITVGFRSFFDPSLHTVTIFKINESDIYLLAVLIYGLSYGMNGLLFLFYPLAGFLADVRWGRYITVKNSLCFLF